MPRIRNISILMVLALVFSCIKPFDPEISGDEEEKYVVVGKVTDTGGWQDVKILTDKKSFIYPCAGLPG